VQRRTISDSFQRPVAVALHGDRVLVADAWMGAVLVLERAAEDVAVLLGAEHGLLEPVSLAVHGDRLFIADAAAHALFVCDLSSEPLQLSRVPVKVPEPVPRSFGPTALVAAACTLLEHSDAQLCIATPEHDDGADAVVDVVDEAVEVLAAARHEVTEVAAGAITILLPIAHSGAGVLRIRLRLAGVTTHYVLPATVSAHGERTATLVLPE